MKQGWFGHQVDPKERLCEKQNPHQKLHSTIAPGEPSTTPRASHRIIPFEVDGLMPAYMVCSLCNLCANVSVPGTSLPSGSLPPLGWLVRSVNLSELKLGVVFLTRQLKRCAGAPNAVCTALIVTSYPHVEAHITVNNCSAVEFPSPCQHHLHSGNQSHVVDAAFSFKFP